MYKLRTKTHHGEVSIDADSFEILSQGIVFVKNGVTVAAFAEWEKVTESKIVDDYNTLMERVKAAESEALKWKSRLRDLIEDIRGDLKESEEYLTGEAK